MILNEVAVEQDYLHLL